MSAADIGRRKIEDREAEFLTIGDRVLDEFGVDWEITQWSRRNGSLKIGVRRLVSPCRVDVWRLDPQVKVRVRR